MSIHMRIHGITGGCADKSHQGWIDVLDIQWGVSRAVTSRSSTCGGRESANARVTSATVLKFMDAASPLLFLEACCGRGKDIAVDLTASGVGSGSEVFMSYVLERTLISGYRVEFRALGNSRFVSYPRPVERLALSFAALESKYTPFDQTGRPMAPIAVGFDMTTNVRL